MLVKVVAALLRSRHDTMSQAVVLPGFARQFHLYLDRPLPRDVESVVVPPALAFALPRRRTQFRSGRYCAMKAIEALDGLCAEPQIGRSVNGAPVWPKGIVGSITHTDDFAAAAVALTSDARAVGIDTERIMSDSQARNVGCIVAWPAEVAHARTAGLSRLEAVTLVFSAKESIFKCLHPIVACYFDFHDVRIVEVDGPRRTFTARVVRTLSEAFPAGTMLRGSFEVEVLWVHTGIALPPRISDPCRALA
jgi:enterobactin synthetase component D